MSQQIWMNGELVPYEDAKVHVLTHALHYGTSVFEGVRAYETPDGSSCVIDEKGGPVRQVGLVPLLGEGQSYGLSGACRPVAS